MEILPGDESGVLVVDVLEEKLKTLSAQEELHFVLNAHKELRKPNIIVSLEAECFHVDLLRQGLSSHVSEEVLQLLLDDDSSEGFVANVEKLYGFRVGLVEELIDDLKKVKRRFVHWLHPLKVLQRFVGESGVPLV